MGHQKIPLSRAIIWILFSVLLIPGSALMGWLHYLRAREIRLHDDQYNIVAIIQQSSQGEGLQTAYLANLLDLTVDQPVNIYTFNITSGENKLTSSPLIRRATIKKVLPGTLYIAYEMRQPIAYLGDYTNTAIDKEGYLFPFRPFFTPKKLPTIYFGLEQPTKQWGDSLQQHPSFKWFATLLQQFQIMESDRLILKQLDLSKTYATSYGQREIIATLQESDVQEIAAQTVGNIFYLRLNSLDFMQNLKNFQTLYTKLLQKQPHPTQIIDLRIPHLAFIDKSH